MIEMFDDIWDWLIKETNGERELTGNELIEYLMQRFGLSREEAEMVEMFQSMPQGGPLSITDTEEEWQSLLERGDPIDMGFRLLKADFIFPQTQYDFREHGGDLPPRGSVEGPGSFTDVRVRALALMEMGRQDEARQLLENYHADIDDEVHWGQPDAFPIDRRNDPDLQEDLDEEMNNMRQRQNERHQHRRRQGKSLPQTTPGSEWAVNLQNPTFREGYPELFGDVDYPGDDLDEDALMNEIMERLNTEGLGEAMHQAGHDPLEEFDRNQYFGDPANIYGEKANILAQVISASAPDARHLSNDEYMGWLRDIMGNLREQDIGPHDVDEDNIRLPHEDPRDEVAPYPTEDELDLFRRNRRRPEVGGDEDYQE